jgi:sec-independent protein translocase protein TatA
MPSWLGGPELLIVLVIVILIFGVGRIANIGGELGKGIKEFRKGLKPDDEKKPDDEEKKEQ